MDKISELLDNALVAVARGDHRHPDLRLTAFLPVKGDKSTGQLMIVGRAVNGWGKGWRPQEALDPRRREVIIEALKSPAWARGKCPMSWISRDWGKGGYTCGNCDTPCDTQAGPCACCGADAIGRRYNTAKSAFYRVMRSVTEALKIADTSEAEWPSFLMWTNLYKIAPAAGGNPSSGLARLQHEACVKMLNEEIRQWKPLRILFLTGLDWAEPFFSGIGMTTGTRLDGPVAYAGKIRLSPNGAEASAVVGPHPQGKAEREIVDQVVRTLSSL